MSISYNGISTNIRVPMMAVEFDNTNAVQGPALMPYRNLIIAQRLNGTIPAGTLMRVTSKALGDMYFGQGSMASQMIEIQLMNNPVTETWVITLDDDDAGNEATGSIEFGGSVTNGTVYLYLGGRRVKVGVGLTDTLADIASNAVTAINARTDLGVTAEVDGGVTSKVNLTARHKGEAHNDLDIRVNYYDGETLPGNLTATITAMSGGTGNPDIDPIWAIIGDVQYNIISMPYTDVANLVSLETELADRYGPMRMIEGHAFTAKTGTHSVLGTFGDSRNSPHLSVMHCSGSPSAPWEWAAGLAGVASYFGNIDPARPFQTLPIKGVLPPKEKDRFTLTENNLLLYDGISTFSVDSGGQVCVQRAITTYKITSNGAEDISYLDVTSPLTLGYLRYDWRNYVLRKYPRHKLGNDSRNYGAGQKIMTPMLGKAEAIARARIWEEMALVENVDQFKAGVICERNQADPNRLDWKLIPDLVNQFRVGATQISFLL